MTAASACSRVGQDVQLSQYPNRFANSLIVAVISTVLAVGMGTFTAYGFSRFKMKGEADLLFFILSTRMLPPIVVAIPMFLMYRTFDLTDTHLGLIILYTAFNLSFSVWLMKGFMDEIPKEYEEAALVDGYSRLQAFFKVVLPEATTGIAATAVFCFITAWNEYAFALILTNRRAQTAPPFIPSQIGSGLPEWTVIAAGTVPLPVAGRDSSHSFCATTSARRHLRRNPEIGPAIVTFREASQKYLEPGSQWLMVVGVVALCQPWNEVIHRYSVTIILIGLVGFNVFSKINRARKTNSENDGRDTASTTLRRISATTTSSGSSTSPSHTRNSWCCSDRRAAARRRRCAPSPASRRSTAATSSSTASRCRT